MKSYNITDTRTFHIPHQPKHPYLDWAKSHFINQWFDKYYKAFPEAKIFAQSMGRAIRTSRTYQMESK